MLRDIATTGAGSLNLLHDIHALDNLSEDGMLTVEPTCDYSSDEELPSETLEPTNIDIRKDDETNLGTIGVGPGVCHRQETRLGVFQMEVFIYDTSVRNCLSVMQA